MLCPDPFPAEFRERLIAWGFEHGQTIAAIDHAIENVRDWSHSKGVQRADWVATVRNGIRNEWALRGFTPQPPNGHAAAKPARYKPFIEEEIEAVLANHTEPREDSRDARPQQTYDLAQYQPPRSRDR